MTLSKYFTLKKWLLNKGRSASTLAVGYATQPGAAFHPSAAQRRGDTRRRASACVLGRSAGARPLGWETLTQEVHTPLSRMPRDTGTGVNWAFTVATTRQPPMESLGKYLECLADPEQSPGCTNSILVDPGQSPGLTGPAPADPEQSPGHTVQQRA